MIRVRTVRARSILALGCLLLAGCAQSGWNGVFQTDMQGGARSCSASSVTPADGQTVAVQMQVSNEGGWCGVNAVRNGQPFDAPLLVARAAHGTPNVHRVGPVTRIDYTPDTGYTGTDSFAVRMIPGDATVRVDVTVTR